MTTYLNGKRHPGRGGVEWNRVRDRVLAASQVCHVCGRYIDLDADPRSKWAPTVDHLLPIRAIRNLSPAEQKRLALDESLLRPAHVTARPCDGSRPPAKCWPRGLPAWMLSTLPNVPSTWPRSSLL
jgi:hypothetical protein